MERWGLLNVSVLLNHLQSLPRSKSTVGHQFKPDEKSYISRCRWLEGTFFARGKGEMIRRKRKLDFLKLGF